MTYDRYLVPEDENFEPGSNNQVLHNLLAIKDVAAIEQLEEQELLRFSAESIDIYNETHQFLSNDICNLHAMWLVDIYPFAGKYRTVMMSKNGFPFASPAHIPKLMFELESKYLKKYTPCQGLSDEELVEALAVVHVELIIIHPFREGNGRVSRLLANLMALQADRDVIDYSLIDRTIHPEGYNKYIAAIQEGFCGDYRKIKDVFSELLKPNR